jgi:hypothetical protein
MRLLESILICTFAGVFLAGVCNSQINKTYVSCTFEPDWRPTHIYDATVHVVEVGGSTVTVGINGARYRIHAKGCKGNGCSIWSLQEVSYYPGRITDQPRYTPECLRNGEAWIENRHKVELPATRKLCVGFGKITVQEFRFGSTHQSEVESCYEVSDISERPTDKRGRPAPSFEYHLSDGIAYCEYAEINSNGDWERSMHQCSR